MTPSGNNDDNDDGNMDYAYLDKDEFEFVPNTILFSTTIHAWAKSDEDDRGARAEALLVLNQICFKSVALQSSLVMLF